MDTAATPSPRARATRWLARGLPFVFGGLYGLFLRLVFSGMQGNSDGKLSPMTFSFAVLVPAAVGAITVYLAERKAPRSWTFYIFGPWIAVSLFMLGTALALIEGSICIAMAMPLFLGAGSIGGLLMGCVCRRWNKPLRTIQSIAILPLLAALGELGHPAPDAIHTIRQSIHIASPAGVVWQHINFPVNIKPEELRGGFAYNVGVPYPVEARTLNQGVRGMRHLIWQRGVSFEEKISAWELERKIAWTYVFNKDSFPAGSMDDHVAIGGKYFNLEDTSYTLTPEGDGTRLDVAVGFRVSTNFNWYAEPLAELMISNTAGTILKFYKARSEAPAPRG
ncbi:hypothetical protein AAKU55_003441 [Oxalobacteraceae bacterium GrIS 1.11]